MTETEFIQNYRKSIIGNCRSCQDQIIAEKNWSSLPAEVRRLLLRNGVNMQKTQGLCQRCYLRIRRRKRGVADRSESQLRLKPKECVECTVQFIPRKLWQLLPKPERVELEYSGAFGLCSSCYASGGQGVVLRAKVKYLRETLAEAEEQLKEFSIQEGQLEDVPTEELSPELRDLRKFLKRG